MLETFHPETPEEDVLEALARDGGVIVEGLASDEVIGRIRDELQPHFEIEGAKFQNDFNGYKTLRLGAILALSRSSAELIAHPYVLSIADALLLPNCESYRLGSATAIEILPGEAQQVLHRDDDFYPFRIPEVEYQFGAMWSFDDFTSVNGATRIVAGKPLDGPSRIPHRRGRGGSLDVERLAASLLRIDLPWRWCQSRRCSSNGAYQHLRLGMATPGRKPIPRDSAGDRGQLS